jgi:hypothetical protein
MNATSMALPSVASQVQCERILGGLAFDRRPPRGPCDEEFVALRDDYRASGGIERGDDLARWMKGRSSGDFVSLARLIVGGEVFSFEWHHSFWIPMFQFELPALRLRDGPRRVLAELAPAFDGWRLAQWFVQPNETLAARRPLDLVDQQLEAVLAAARADRFVAIG